MGDMNHLSPILGEVILITHLISYLLSLQFCIFNTYEDAASSI